MSTLVTTLPVYVAVLITLRVHKFTRLFYFHIIMRTGCRRLLTVAACVSIAARPAISEL